MGFEELDGQLIQTVRRCLELASNGGIFPDWEFDTLVGFSTEEIERIAERWPESDDAIGAAISTLSNLLSYPGFDVGDLESQIGATTAELEQYLEVLRGIAAP